MSQLFTQYSNEIKKSFEIVKKSTFSIHEFPLSKRQTTLPSLKVQMYEIEKLIKLMQTQIISFQGKERNLSSQKIKGFKVQYQGLRKKISSIQQSTRNERSKSSSQTLSSTSEQASSSQKNRYSKLQNSPEENINIELKQSIKVMYGTLEMGDNIQVELQGQTQKINHSKSKLGLIRDQLTKGQKKIKKMMVRLRRNKLMLYAVIGFVILVVLYVLIRLIGG